MFTMDWTVETLNDVVDAEIEDLPADMRARFRYISPLIEGFGLERVRPLWEMGMKGKDGISRALYVTAVGRLSMARANIWWIS